MDLKQQERIKNSIRDDWNKHYTNVSKHIVDENWDPFLNHGYRPLDNSKILNYDLNDKTWENQANLYAHVIELYKKYKIDFKTVNLLDIGCGMGHGPKIYKKYYDFEKITAIDFTEGFIENAKNNSQGVTYQVADATNMPFENNSFNLLTNIESLHNYIYTYHFYFEVFRILKPGGFLLVSDPFTIYKDDLIAEDWFSRAGFYMTDKINITPMVIESCYDDVKNFAKKHTNISQEKVDAFVTLANEKLETYSQGRHNFYTYVYVKPKI